MDNYLEALLLNMLFLFVFLLFIPHVVETNLKNLSSKKKKIIFLAAAIVAIISCMSFPFRIGNEIIMDLRSVAIIVGGLYLGRQASVILVGVLLIYRLYLGGLGSGFYATLIVSMIVLFFLILLVNVFEKATKKKKIIIACYISLLTNAFVLIVRSTIFNQPFSSLLMAASTFLLLHFLSTFFIVYFSEVIRETVFVNKRIIKAEKLEIVSHLASSISHEVRNPLTVVKGFLQLLNQNDLPEDKRKRFIELSLQEIERANDIIRNYLTFAKPAPEKSEILDLKQELNRSIEVITPLANMNCVKIHTEIDIFYLIGEPQLLQQCFINIIKNCIEAMPSGGNLFIKTEEINGEILIEITDNGKGMTNEQLLRLGEPYFTTKGREGTGLGMMVVLKIIEIMNGKLDVTSNINEGTQFKIYLPKNVENYKKVTSV